jgi:hypothetical protein
LKEELQAADDRDSLAGANDREELIEALVLDKGEREEGDEMMKKKIVSQLLLDAKVVLIDQNNRVIVDVGKKEIEEILFCCPRGRKREIIGAIRSEESFLRDQLKTLLTDEITSDRSHQVDTIAFKVALLQLDVLKRVVKERREDREGCDI